MFQISWDDIAQRNTGDTVSAACGWKKYKEPSISLSPSTNSQLLQDTDHWTHWHDMPATVGVYICMSMARAQLIRKTFP